MTMLRNGQTDIPGQVENNIPTGRNTLRQCVGQDGYSTGRRQEDESTHSKQEAALPLNKTHLGDAFDKMAIPTAIDKGTKNILSKWKIALPLDKTHLNDALDKTIRRSSGPC